MANIPIKGGSTRALYARVHYLARQEVAEVAGHSRETISKAYVGK